MLILLLLKLLGVIYIKELSVCLFYVPYVNCSAVIAVFTEVRGTYARFSREIVTDRFFEFL